MADIEITIDSANDLSIIKVHGELTLDEIIQTASKLYIQQPTRLVLWDLTEGTHKNISVVEFRGLAQKMRLLTGQRKAGKTAFVGSTDVDYGFFRMYEAFAELENIEVKYKTFKDIAAAKRWLGVRD
ncbi:MAG: hypothetical protein FOGNACKC_04699 [Anaerolineae bacterium]|nr:hypothetical protein [Anaerolineae bacterium]